MSNFDLEFHYPAGWTLVATGKRTDAKSSSNPGDQVPAGASSAGGQVSRWISERPIPIAGFDLGKYDRAVAHAGDVTVETYATAVMERGFPTPSIKSVIPNPIEPAVRTTPRRFSCLCTLLLHEMRKMSRMLPHRRSTSTRDVTAHSLTAI